MLENSLNYTQDILCVCVCVSKGVGHFSSKSVCGFFSSDSLKDMQPEDTRSTLFGCKDFRSKIDFAFPRGFMALVH